MGGNFFYCIFLVYVLRSIDIMPVDLILSENNKLISRLRHVALARENFEGTCVMLANRYIEIQKGTK